MVFEADLAVDRVTKAQRRGAGRSERSAWVVQGLVLRASCHRLPFDVCYSPRHWCQHWELWDRADLWSRKNERRLAVAGRSQHWMSTARPAQREPDWRLKAW